MFQICIKEITLCAHSRDTDRDTDSDTDIYIWRENYISFLIPQVFNNIHPTTSAIKTATFNNRHVLILTLF